MTNLRVLKDLESISRNLERIADALEAKSNATRGNPRTIVYPECFETPEDTSQLRSRGRSVETTRGRSGEDWTLCYDTNRVSEIVRGAERE